MRRRRSTQSVLFHAVLVGFAIAFSARTARSDAVLNPKTYTSASGEYRFEVDPGEPDGAGAGIHRFLHKGEVIWEKELEYTFWDAVVTDRGIVAGYGYTSGYDGRPRGGGAPSELPVVILDRTGEERLRDVRGREHPGIMSTPPSPFAPLIDGILLDEDGDRIIVRTAVYGRADQATWWVYRISSGEKLGDIVPAQPGRAELGFHQSIHALLIPQTPLVVIHWYRYDGHARFNVVDEQGKEIWMLDLENEYAGLGNALRWYDLQEQGIPQIATHIGEFELRSYKLGQAVKFKVERDNELPGGWKISEIARRDVQLVAPKEPVPDQKLDLPFPQIVLERVGEITLKAPVAPAHIITGVIDFSIDQQGRMGFISRRNDQEVHFVLLKPDEAVLVDKHLEWPEQEGAMPIAGVTGGGQWLIVKSSYEPNIATVAWRVNIEQSTLEKIEGCPTERIDRIASYGEGGFLFQVGDALLRFDERARKLEGFAIPGIFGVGSGQTFVPMRDGSIAVLDPSPCSILIYDSNGHHTRTIDLTSKVGEDPWCFGSLGIDGQGNLLLESGNPSTLHRIAESGEVAESRALSFPDGRTFEIRGGIRLAPDGRLWTSDGNALLRLDDNWTVDRIIGPKPSDDDLQQIEDLAVNEQGNIYALNQRTQAVHVFNREGTQLKILRPEPTDFPGSKGAGPVTVSGDGWVYVGRKSDAMYSSIDYLKFDATGERQDFDQLRLDSIQEDWHFRPGTMERWVLGYDSVFLIDDLGKTSLVIRRRPDNNWLERVDAGAVAADGSLMVVSSPGGWGFSRSDSWLSFYKATGKGITSARSPLGSFQKAAWTGRFAAVCDEEHLVLLEPQSGECRHMKLPAKNWWNVEASPDGSEIWLWTSESRVVQRYRLPER